MSFDSLPIWAIFLGTAFLVIITIELGFRLGHRSHLRSGKDKESSVSAVSGIILGLVALILAFTFGTVTERYESKKALVREDAIAIQAAWQLSDFLPEADRAEAASLLRDYMHLRVNLAEGNSLEPEQMEKTLDKTKKIQKRLWDMAVTNARKDMNSDVAALYIDSLNHMNAINTTRITVGIHIRIPREIWMVLYCLTVLGMLSVGYQAGIVESKRSIIQLILVVSFSFVLTLIASLDRPDSGIMKIKQQPLIDLLSTMDTK